MRQKKHSHTFSQLRYRARLDLKLQKLPEPGRRRLGGTDSELCDPETPIVLRSQSLVQQEATALAGDGWEDRWVWDRGVRPLPKETRYHPVQATYDVQETCTE